MSTNLPAVRTATAIRVQNKREAVERLTTSLEEIVTIRSDWMDDKRAELARAIEAQKALAGAGADPSKLRYARNRVTVLRKIVNCLEAGFMPIPSFDSIKVNVDIRAFPLKALVAINDAQATGLFDEVEFVEGREAERGAGYRPRRPARDPFLIGVVRMPAVDYRSVRDGWYHDIHLPAVEQAFLLAWWKPTDEIDGDLW